MPGFSDLCLNRLRPDEIGSDSDIDLIACRISLKPPSPLSSEVQELPKVQTLRQYFNEGQAVAAPHLRQPAPHGGFAGLEPLSPTVTASP